MKTAQASVLLVGGHALARAAIARTLTVESSLWVCGTEADVEAAVKRIPILAPGIVVLDASGMDSATSAIAIERLTGATPDAQLLVMALPSGGPQARMAMEAGAHGYVLWSSRLRTLFTALDALIAGKTFIDPSAITAPISHPGPNVDDLTHREREVLGLIGRGHTSMEISQLLGLSVRTVETHRSRVAGKLHARTRADLVAHALSAGLVAS
jgi:two-component system response regulator NreC